MATITVTYINFSPALTSTIQVELFYKVFGSTDNWTSFNGNAYTVNANGNLASPAVATGLTAGVSYLILAKSDCGTSLEKKISTPSACNEVTNAVITPGTNGISISFTAPTGAIGYVVEVFRGSLPYNGGTLVGTYYAGPTLPIVISDHNLVLPPGTYYVQIKTLCLKGESDWSDYFEYEVVEAPETQCEVSIINPWTSNGSSFVVHYGTLYNLTLAAYGDASVQHQVARCASSLCWPPCNLLATGTVLDSSGNPLRTLELLYNMGGYITITGQDVIAADESIVASFDSLNCGNQEE